MHAAARASVVAHFVPAKAAVTLTLVELRKLTDTDGPAAAGGTGAGAGAGAGAFAAPLVFPLAGVAANAGTAATATNQQHTSP
jgi:hypothetical protein